MKGSSARAASIRSWMMARLSVMFRRGKREEKERKRTNIESKHHKRRESVREMEEAHSCQQSCESSDRGNSTGSDEGDTPIDNNAERPSPSSFSRHQPRAFEYSFDEDTV